MADFRVATQLFLGENEQRLLSNREISRRIARARELAGVDTLMIWAGADPARYEPLVRACRDSDVTPYLWFPVLADAPGVTVGRNELLLHHDGTRGYGRTGAWKGLGVGEEQFLFCCPNNSEAVSRILRVCTELLDRLGFAGIMLDRIRYPSAVNGLESLFGCYCRDCQEQFAAMFDSAPDGLEGQRQAVAALLSRPGRPGKPGSFTELWAQAGLSDLFAFKERSVARVVERFSAAARARKLQVGLDLYSPSLAPTVSQDYALLSHFCDWLKPMIYRHAVGPAGLPLEVAFLQRAVRTAWPNLSAAAVKDLLRGLLPWEWPEDEESLLAQGLSDQTLTVELDRVRGQGLTPGVRVLVGLEAIRNPAFHVDISRRSLEQSLEALHGRSDGLVASWNLLYLPEENLKAIGAFASRG